MNMASTGVLLFIFTVIYICEGNLSFVNVQCTNKVGQHGETSLLECVVITKQDITDLRIRVVTWKKEGEWETLLVFHGGELEQLPGYSFAEPSWNDRNMNVSLLIASTTPKDMGTYECMVVTNMGIASDKTKLEVTAKYSEPTINSKPETGTLYADRALVCNSDGGYPEGRLRWFDEHIVEWTKSATMEAKQTNSGLFQLSSTLTLFKGSSSSTYTCMVFNASGGKESEATYGNPQSGAKYSEPTINSKPETGTLNADMTLVCTSYGGYPKGRLGWFDEHNVEWTKSATMEVKQTNGRFQLSSKLTLLKGSSFYKFTCVVFNARGDKESEVTYEIDDPQSEGSVSVSKIVAPLVVIGSLVVGLLLALLFHRRRSQRHHQGVPSRETDVEGGGRER